MLRRKTTLILLVLTVALSLVAGTWYAATQFQSSAQREAAAQPPQEQPILVPIERNDLVEKTTLKATARRGGEQKYPLPKPAPTSVITHEGVQKGQQLFSGVAIVWINDRPLIALKGVFPLYRDLGPGDTGEDVRMIQRALADLGYNITADGIFGNWTAQCLNDLYKDNGAQAPQRDKKLPTVLPADTPQSGSLTHSLPTPQKETYLPASEVLIISDLPAYITAVPPVGTILGEENSALILATSTLKLTSEIPSSIAARLAEGMKGNATLQDTTINVSIAGIDTQKNNENTDETAQGSGKTIAQFHAADGTIPTEWAEQSDILITINFSDPLIGVLTVPQRAIATDADGTPTILIHTDNTFVATPVKQLGCVAGMCAIEAAHAGEPLKEDMYVRVDR